MNNRNHDQRNANIPTRTVRLQEEVLNGIKGSVSPQRSHSYETVQVPDLEALGMDELATESLLCEKRDRLQAKVEHKTWEALFDIAESNDEKQLNASGTEKFTDVLMDACEKLHRQSSTPDEALLFMNRKTKGYVRDWMDKAVRFNSPTESEKALQMQIGGVSLTPVVSKHPEPDQIVLVGDILYAAPQSVPCVVIDNLPIGINIRVMVDGEDNEIVID